MTAVLGVLASPSAAVGVIAIVCLIVGFVAVAGGSWTIGLAAFGVLALVVTELDVQIWKVSIPVGLVLIFAAFGLFVLH